jgi:hypothetical protein
MTSVDQKQTEAIRQLVPFAPDVTDADGRPVAKFLQTQAVLRAP